MVLFNGTKFECDSHIVNKSKNIVQTAKFLNGNQLLRNYDR